MQPIQGVENRNELLALPSNPRGYIGEMVLPALKTVNKVGYRYAAAPVTASTAQSGRTAAASISNIGTLASNPVSFTCAEVLKRMIIGDEEAAEFGSEDQYLAVLAWTASKQVRDAVEAKIATLTANASSPTDISAAIFTGIKTKVDLLSAYGPVCIAGSVTAFNTLRSDATVIDRMKATGTVLTPIVETRSISANQIAAMFGADACFEAKTDTAIWNTNRLFAYVKPDASVDPMSTPQLGRLLTYTYRDGEEAQQELACQLMWDTTLRTNVLDVVGYNVGKIFNSFLGYHLSLDGN